MKLIYAIITHKTQIQRDPSFHDRRIPEKREYDPDDRDGRSAG